MQALLRGLSEVGYVYGEHFVTEARGGGEAGALPRPGDRPRPYQAGRHRQRRTVAVIPQAGDLDDPHRHGGAADPVADGFAQTLARPGANFTGFSLQFLESTGKRLELLKVSPRGPAPVAVLFSRVDLSGQASRGRRPSLRPGTAGGS